MRLAAGTKNPYRIYFPKTDSMGRAELQADESSGQFKAHWEEGLMDFNGTLESAPQDVTLFLCDVAAIRSNRRVLMAWPLLTHERELWTSRQQKIDYFLSCANERYSFLESSVLIPDDGKLRVEVSESKRRAG
jgi:hypothetical protein